MTPSNKLSSEDFAALFDAAPDAIIVVDDRGIIAFANQRTADLFGWSCTELIGRPIETLVPQRLRAKHVGDRNDYIAAPTTRPMGSGRELLAVCKDGVELPVEISLSPLRTAGGVLVSSIIRDVSDRRRREEELRRMQALAEAASRAKSEFLSSMSHELRTPLNAILGFTQLLRRDKKQPLVERQRTMLEHVIKGGEHLLRLIDDVLDLSRIEAGGVTISTEPVRVPEVLKEVRDALEPLAARAGIELVVADTPADALEISADRTRFTQILVNYGSNAIKYGRSGGFVRFGATRVMDRVRVTVVDDGIGIAPDKHDRIFQPFQRAGQETGPIEGTGIGLAITKRLAQLMDGDVGFESELDRGSTFWVELPHWDGAKQDVVSLVRDVKNGSTLESPDAPRVRVVYIEDNPANVAFMEQLLSEFESVELLTAPSAEIGIEMVRRTRPQVVIMDVNLPGMNGFDATRKLREWPDTRDIPVIGLSAAAMPRDRKRAEEAGFHRYLTKPVDVDALVAVLEEVLEQRTPAH